MCGKQLDLRPCSHQPLGSVKDFPAMPHVRGDHSNSYLGPAVEILAADLGGRYREAALELGHDRPNDRPLLFQRAEVAQQQVQAQGSGEQRDTSSIRAARNDHVHHPYGYITRPVCLVMYRQGW
jgi:hypothetical protein